MLIPEYYEYQKSKKKKSYEANEIFEAISKFMKENSINDTNEAFDYILESVPENYDKNHFYYPGICVGRNEKNYSDDDALYFFKELISTTSLDVTCESLVRYCLALKKAFLLLAQIKNPSRNTILFLWERFYGIEKNIEQEWMIFLEKEKQRERNKNNRANVKKRIKFITEHHVYQEIESLIEQLKPGQLSREQNKIFFKIDDLIRQVIDIDNKKDAKTIRRYRHRILSVSYKNTLLDKKEIEMSRTKFGLDLY